MKCLKPKSGTKQQMIERLKTLGEFDPSQIVSPPEYTRYEGKYKRKPNLSLGVDQVNDITYLSYLNELMGKR